MSANINLAEFVSSVGVVGSDSAARSIDLSSGFLTTSKKRKPNEQTQTCARIGCGVRFVPHHNGQQRFCSRRCVFLQWWYGGVLGVRKCAYPGCGLEFQPRRKDQLYHDPLCRHFAYMRRNGRVRKMTGIPY